MVEKSISGAILASKTLQKSKKNRLKTICKKDTQKTKKKEPTGPPKGCRSAEVGGIGVGRWEG